jgi:hypothetical protein
MVIFLSQGRFYLESLAFQLDFKSYVAQLDRFSRTGFGSKGTGVSAEGLC